MKLFDNLRKVFSREPYNAQQAQEMAEMIIREYIQGNRLQSG